MPTELEQFKLAAKATIAAKDYQRTHLALSAAEANLAELTAVVALLRAKDARLGCVAVNALDAALDAVDEDEVKFELFGDDAKRAVSIARCTGHSADEPHPLEGASDPGVKACCVLFESLYRV